MKLRPVGVDFHADGQTWRS